MSLTHPLIIAHRGGASLKPENTLQAFEHALSHGAHGIETDIQLTADDVFICWHDKSFRRMGRSKLYPSQLNFDKIQQLKIPKHPKSFDAETYSTSTITSCEHLLRLYSQSEHHIFLELKWFKRSSKQHSASHMIEKLGELLRRHQNRSNVKIISFEAALLMECRQQNIPSPLIYLLPYQDHKLSVKHWQTFDGIGFDISKRKPQELIHLPSDMKTLCYTCRSHGDFSKARDWNVDYWMCDDPIEALNWTRRNPKT